MARQPRQRPISCKLCRQRKLRCSRVFPCSNCVCRGLECVHDGPTSAATAPSSAISPGAGGGASANAAAASQDKTPPLPKELPASELLARLEKLEALVANQSKDVPAVPPVVPPQLSQPQRPLPAFPGNTPNLTSHTTATTSSPISPQIQRLTDDALWLERSCSGNSLVVSVCPLRERPPSAPRGSADFVIRLHVRLTMYKNRNHWSRIQLHFGHVPCAALPSSPLSYSSRIRPMRSWASLMLSSVSGCRGGTRLISYWTSISLMLIISTM